MPRHNLLCSKQFIIDNLRWTYDWCRCAVVLVGKGVGSARGIRYGFWLDWTIHRDRVSVRVLQQCKVRCFREERLWVYNDGLTPRLKVDSAFSFIIVTNLCLGLDPGEVK
jgi:hypothetical protein